MRTTPPADLPGPRDSIPPSDPASIHSFDNIHKAKARVYRPANVAELAGFLREASGEARTRHITFRAGGQALDSQSLNDDVVIYLEAPELSKVGEPACDAAGHYITVGAGATWGDIVRKTTEKGLLPWSVVTTKHATAGGTVACDCLSRCSPISGKEGDHVRSFKLLTVDGTLIECSRDDADPARKELFHAVIGSMGYLGVVVEITIDLRPPVPGWASHTLIRVLTHADKYIVGSAAGCRWSEVLPRLEETSSRVRVDGKGHGILAQIFHLKDAPEDTTRVDWDAVSASAWYGPGGTEEVFLFKSLYAVGMGLDPLPFYERSNRLLTDMPSGFDSPLMTELVEWGMFLLCPARTYVNALFDFMFFMENQLAPVRAAAKDEGWRLNAIQQTFLVPLAAPTAEDPSGTRLVAAFLDEIRSEEGLRPCFLDLLFLREDDFLLSASRGLEGFAITVTWTAKNADIWPQVKERLHALSRSCRRLGGRVHMVKNVEADREDLHAMYGDGFDRFLALKRQHDPRGLLRNEFFDRIFGPI